MASCYEFEAWQLGGGLGFYHSKLKMITLICAVLKGYFRHCPRLLNCIVQNHYNKVDIC